MKMQIRVAQVLLYSLSLLLPLLIGACRPTPNAVVSALSQAEKFMDTNPDSALILLQQIPHPQQLNGKAQADYALLMTQAMDKNYMKQESDSLISLAVLYYDANRDLYVERGKAYYYYGRVMQELDRPGEAMESYLKAKKILDGSEQYKLLGSISEEMGHLNRKQELFESALGDYKTSFSFYVNGADSLFISYAYRNIGRVFLFNNQSDSALWYYDKGLAIAQLKGYASETSILQDMGMVYRAMGDYPQAERCFLASAEKETKKEYRCSDYLSLGYLYLKMEECDKAKKYLNLCIASSNLLTQASGYECLYSLACKNGDLEQAIVYKTQTDSLRKVVQNRDNLALMADLQKRYDNEKLQRYNLQMTILNRNVLLYSIGFLFLAILAILYFFYKSHINKQRVKEIEETIAANNKEIFRYKLEKTKYDELKGEAVNDYRNKIGELNGKIMVLSTQNKELNERLKTAGVEEKVPSITVTNSLIEEQMASFRVLLSLKNGASLSKMPAEEWENIKSLFDLLYSNFGTRLIEAYPHLTKHDIEICCLLKCGFTHEELARVFVTTPDSVTKAKGRLKKRLSISAQEDLDSFLLYY